MHLCCSEKKQKQQKKTPIRWTCPSTQNVTWSLDLDVHCCLPTCVCSLQRLYFSAFGSSMNWYVLKSRLVPSFQTLVKVHSLNLHTSFPTNSRLKGNEKNQIYFFGEQKTGKDMSVQREARMLLCVSTVKVEIWRAAMTVATGPSENGLWLNLIIRERRPPNLADGCVRMHGFEHSRWLSRKYVFSRWG